MGAPSLRQQARHRCSVHHAMPEPTTISGRAETSWVTAAIARLSLQTPALTGTERRLVFRGAGSEVPAHGKAIGRLHGAERQGVVGHDQGRHVIDEDDDVNALFQIVLRPMMQLVVIGLLAVSYTH